ncbi:MAG: hypothetical protein ABFC98_02035, partial [Candidatus Cloacimonas sp.]
INLCKFLGDISYPLYMVHYPFIYLYYAWVKHNNLTFGESLPGLTLTMASTKTRNIEFRQNLYLNYKCLTFYQICHPR